MHRRQYLNTIGSVLGSTLVTGCTGLVRLGSEGGVNAQSIEEEH